MRRVTDEGTCLSMLAWVADLGFAEIEHRIADGSLLPLLDAELTSCGPMGRLQAVRLGYAKHHRDCSAMVLQLTFASAAAELAVTRELVLYVPRRPASAVSARAWWYPADPYLPGLQHLTRGGDFFHPSRWEKPWAGLDPEVALSVRRLAYYPGRRASFLIDSAGASTQLVVKFVGRAAFGESVAVAERLAETPLGDDVVVPRLLSYSSRHCALLYNYVPGTGLDQLHRAQRSAPHLRAYTARVLARIHAVAAPGLRQWSAAKELGQTRLLVAEAQQRFPSVGGIEPFFDSLVATLSRSREPYLQLIHNDFSARNVLRRPSASEMHGPESLAVIDWDEAVLGPVERDLASFVSGFTSSRSEARASVATYQHHTGSAIDLELLDAFLKHQRLLKLCRRALAAGRMSPTDFEGVASWPC
jgi:Phosphotransferase enzyme family